MLLLLLSSKERRGKEGKRRRRRRREMEGKESMPRIFFALPDLIEKIGRREVSVTYRTHRLKEGCVYEVHRGSRHRSLPTGMRIRILEAEAVDASRLTDEDARLAGIDSAEALRALFLRWYGTKSPPRLFRNRFVLENEI